MSAAVEGLPRAKASAIGLTVAAAAGAGALIGLAAWLALSRVADAVGVPDAGAGAAAAAWQEDPLWNDGRAEVSVYSASEIKYGLPRRFTWTHVVVAEDLRRDTLVKADGPGPPGSLIRVLKSNQQWDIPTGAYTYHQMASVFLSVGDLGLVKETVTSHELCGNTFHELVVPPEDPGEATLKSFSYFDGEGNRSFAFDMRGVQAYDALPVSLRALPFAAGHSEPIRLLATLVSNRGRTPEIAEAEVRVEGPEGVPTGLGEIEAWKVAVTRPEGTDRLWFERARPNRLLRWDQADGGRYRLENSRRLKYWEMNRPGDEDALLVRDGPGGERTAAPGAVEVPAEPEEKRLRNLRRLTHGGENAEAYWDAEGRRLIFQSTRDGLGCDHIFTMNADGTETKRVSSGLGRTTCAFFFPSGDRIVYSSTHLAGEDCPPPPDMSQGYVWPLHAGYDIFSARPDGSDLKRLTDAPGYDAEATVSPDGRTIVFTSMRDGDPEIYAMDADGRNVRRLTRTPGYDGGPFFSPDGRRIVFRGRHPEGEELADFRRLLGMSLVRPRALEIFTMNADGTGLRQVTRLGGANFCPYWHPDGRRIIFSSNHHNPRGRNFDLYLVNDDGSGLERVTTNATFDGFPMFDRAGRRLVFASNRHGSREGETNIFVADWVD